MLFGLVGAAVAAVAYGTATILQALGVRQIAGLESHASVWSRVVAGRLYAIGLALDGLGFVASVASLRRLPLFLVESAVASSVAVTAVLAVLVLHVRLRHAEKAAIGATSLGLALLGVSAQAGAARHVGTVAGWLLLGSAAVVALVLLVGVRDSHDVRATLVLAVASGVGFGLVGVAARTLQVRDPWWHTAADPVLWALAAQGILASVAYGFALHRGRTTTVAAITFVVETVLPTAIGLVFLGDAVRAHLVPVATIGFLATLGGCIVLARHAETPTAPHAAS